MSKHHTINYIELTAENIEAVKVFYAKSFGWKFTDYGSEYTAFNDGILNGGFAKGELKANGGALVILYSENLEESQETVEKNGGTIVNPIFDFPGGRRFHFTDPVGNELAIWSDK